VVAFKTHDEQKRKRNEQALLPRIIGGSEVTAKNNGKEVSVKVYFAHIAGTNMLNQSVYQSLSTNIHEYVYCK
jgi:hypothetical protein